MEAIFVIIAVLALVSVIFLWDLVTTVGRIEKHLQELLKRIDVLTQSIQKQPPQ